MRAGVQVGMQIDEIARDAPVLVAKVRNVFQTSRVIGKVHHVV